MPNRIIKESICTSDTIDKLTWFEEVVFYRLTVNCDDYGRFDGRTSIIKSRLFPLKNVTEKAVADAINKLSTVDLVKPYSYDGKPILQLATWDKHQSVRNKRSKYPAFDGSEETSASENIQLISIDFNCMQVQADASGCSRNPIQSNPYPNPNPNPKALKCESLFSQFWDLYPKKKAKADAEKAFKALKPDEALFTKITEAVKAQSKSEGWKNEGGKFIPHPATWIRQKRWDDEISKTSEIPGAHFSFERKTENYDYLAIDPFAGSERPTENYDHLATDLFAEDSTHGTAKNGR